MVVAFLSLIAIAAALLMNKQLLPSPTQNYALRGGLLVLGIIGILSRSFVTVDANEVGHLKRIYMAPDLPAGSIIAPDGEKGPQSEIVGPGFHLMPLVKILYDIEYANVVEIP